MNRAGVYALMLGLACWGGWQWWQERPLPVAGGPGVRAAAAPVQIDLRHEPPLQKNGYTLTPLALFDLTALILSKENYHMGREAELSRTDLALGWGRMSDPQVLRDIDISQGNRFFYWHTDHEPPIPVAEITQSASNMHLIAANPVVQDQIDALRPGQVVSLRGKLVRADAPDGWHWVSSTTRTDSGNGACELVYVETLSVQ